MRPIGSYTYSYGNNSNEYSLPYTFRALSDEKSLDLFKTIAATSQDSIVPISKLNLTPKQYYTRKLRLVGAGLIKKDKGKYSLTVLGEILYECHCLAEKAIKDKWKLKAIDIVESSKELGKEEYRKLINELLSDGVLKQILVARKESINNTGPLCEKLQRPYENNKPISHSV
jgi:hypothetical protein